MANINTDNYRSYSKIECYNSADELIFEAVLVMHTDREVLELGRYFSTNYHRVRLTTSQIVAIDES